MTLFEKAADLATPEEWPEVLRALTALQVELAQYSDLSFSWNKMFRLGTGQMLCGQTFDEALQGACSPWEVVAVVDEVVDRITTARRNRLELAIIPEEDWP